MIVLSKNTTRSESEVLDLARDFFDGHFGLKKRDEIEDCCVVFVSELGHVTVQAIPRGKKTEAILRTREFDHQVKEFAQKL